jgi:hypothetical protein
MSIPESQLEAWSSQGATVSAKATHEAVRAALEDYERWPDGIDYEVYLQGSYKNDTNIRADSDVDVVVQLNSAFRYDLSALSESEREAFAASYRGSNDGHFSDFCDHIKSVLEKRFGYWDVKKGAKSIKVPAGPGRLRCDVVPCVQFRRYLSHKSKSDERYVVGMTFHTSYLLLNRWIINYPKEHYKKGVAKHGARGTSGWFKRLVRIFKNIRARLVEKWAIGRDVAPSYFVESLVYNIPNSKFGTSLQETFSNGLDWLSSEADLIQFNCQNGQLKLFGDSDGQWRIDKARTLIKALRRLWDDWYE